MRIPEDLAGRLMLVCAGVFAIATATILAAHAFERIGGYAPCPLCLEERYAYYFGVSATPLSPHFRSKPPAHVVGPGHHFHSTPAW